MMKQKLFVLLFAVLVAVAVQFLDLSLSSQAKTVAGITVFAAILWFTDAVPLFATSLAIPVLLALFAGFTPAKAFAPFFDPLIVLLLGGAVLARALVRYELDVVIVRFFLGLTGVKPKRFLLGLMLATAFVSMWISNTATALMMMPIGVAALAVTSLQPGKSSFGKAVVLGVAFAATIGGLGTLVGTPPNLIAANALEKFGVFVGFFEWSLKAAPVMIALLFAAWLVLCRMYAPEVERIHVEKIKKKPLSLRQKTVLAVFALTVVLWVTESVHGIHNSLVALFPVFAFFAIDFLDADDFGKIGWDSLVLVGGGLSIGAAISASQLDVAIAGLLASTVAGQPVFLTLILVGLFMVFFTAFVPNTAGAAILLPLLLPLAPVLGVPVKSLALLAGMAVSFDFIVPTGTPPNAIAYGTRFVRVSDIIKAGLAVSLAGVLVVSVFALFWF